MDLTPEQQQPIDAIEHQDLDAMLDLLDGGVSLTFAVDGMSPLQIAIDSRPTVAL